jgi:trimeric autotransporter adhesin
MVLGNNQINVGIGTSAPAANLEVVNTNFPATGRSGLQLSSIASSLFTGAVRTDGQLTVSTTGEVVWASNSNAAAGGLWLKEADGLLKNNNTKGVVIGDGITSRPAGYKLYVADGILTEKVKVSLKNTASWSDFVFNKDYTLKPLAEVEQYINDNHHLPEVPSAEQMVKEGNDMLKTDALLLQKIEELMLYTIAINKEVQQLKKENELLKKRKSK